MKHYREIIIDAARKFLESPITLKETGQDGLIAIEVSSPTGFFKSAYSKQLLYNAQCNSEVEAFLVHDMVLAFKNSLQP